MIVPYLIAAVFTAVVCVGIAHAFGGAPAAVPVVEHAVVTAYAQAINVVEINSDTPSVNQFVRRSDESVAEINRRIKGEH